MTSPSQNESHDEGLPSRWATLPNAVTLVRIIGSPALIVLAYWQQYVGLGVLLGVLVLTEWLDGFLARSLHQQSSTGARLDTIADAVFYSSMLGAVTALVPARVAANILWIGAAMGSYLCSWLYSWFKFRRLPSYHTVMAKSAWFVVAPGIVCLVLGRHVWLFQLAMVIVAVANLEAIAITWRLKKSRVNVPSLLMLRKTEE